MVQEKRMADQRQVQDSRQEAVATENDGLIHLYVAI